MSAKMAANEIRTHARTNQRLWNRGRGNLGLPRPRFQSLWLVRAWVQIPFAATFVDIPRGWFKLMTSRLLFSNLIWKLSV